VIVGVGLTEDIEEESMKGKHIIVSVSVLIICFFLISWVSSTPELHAAASKNIPGFHNAASKNDLEGH